MKKLLTLVLCWLLSFESFGATTFKAKTSVSVAGGYVTSLNKIDGSFEDGSTQWSASVGTIVPTASTEFQGNYKGVWSGTGTGTLDLQWTATASNTFEASMQFRSPVADSDHYVCAMVNGVETGCKLVDGPDYTVNTIRKISVVANSVMSSSFYLRLKHTGSDAFSVEVDDGKIEPWTQNVLNLNTNEAITYTGFISKDTSHRVLLKTKDISRSLYGSLIDIDTSISTYIKYRVLKPCNANVSASGYSSASALVFVNHYDSSNTALQTPTDEGANAGSPSFSGRVNAGDYFIMSVGPTMSPQDITNTHFSITCSAISDNVVQSWQDGMASWSATSTIQIGATTTAPTKGTTDLDQVKWIKRGESAEFWYQYNQTGAGSAGSGDYLFTLPSGLQFKNDTTFYTTIEGGSDAWTTKNTIPAGALSATGGYMYSLYILPYSSNQFRVGMIGGLQGSNSSVGVLGSGFQGFGVTSLSISLKFSAPIQGWSSTPPLLALPTSKENVFSAFINANNTIRSTNTDWIASVITQSAGVKRITFKPGIFTVAPVVVSLYGDGGSTYAERISWSVGTQTATYVDIATAGSASMDSTVPFNIVVMKQSPDYTAPGVFVGNVQPEWQYDLTVTGTNWTTTRAVGVVYKMANGQYRMRFNITGAVTSQTSNTLTISGVTFKNITNFYQGITAVGPSGAYSNGYASPNASTLTLNSGSSITSWQLSGDVELESKPTFAVNTP